MQQGDIIRVSAFVAAAGVGAALALGGAELTGRLGSSTTIEQVTTTAAPAVTTSSTTTSGDLSVQQIYKLDAPGVVQISSKEPSPYGLGSGFVIDKAGHILTSSHVISGARGVQVSFSGADQLNATVVGKDPSTDVAVLQVAAHSRSLSPLPLGDSDLVQVGDPVVAIGNTPSLMRTATVGIISAVQHGIDDLNAGGTYAHTIQTDAAINHGNSGGPLINTRGQVIGISAQLAPASDPSAAAAQAAGFGFAIPIDTVKSVVAQLLTTGKVQHAYLGIDAAPVSESLAHSFALPCNYGLIVQSVTPGSAAARAGLRAGTTEVAVAGESYRLGGDIIVAANGKPIAEQAELRDVIQAMKPGQTLALQIWRGSTKENVHVKLGRPPG